MYLNYAKTLALLLLLAGFGSFGWISTTSYTNFTSQNAAVYDSEETVRFSSNQTDNDRFPSQILLEEEKEVEDECSFVPLEVNRLATTVHLTFTSLPCRLGNFVEGNTFPSPVPIWLAKRCLLL
jgi:hypothetical protein